ncbi:putative ABC transporter [Eremomyces bilateralis CBS 781.70]|uniref:ABC transporter n=1 Tax=Eremomyces bilateralis CBS 781.70 TaxID=1392243 RepID=A0A6G1G5P3_9PEZI|nr:putative ABC transporter [Eremomyces bilateralis CBS 781.70]KAF1813415.1 putative ABC transporter [Eremomyces bilateralis CBS 781.70]
MGSDKPTPIRQNVPGGSPSYRQSSGFGTQPTPTPGTGNGFDSTKRSGPPAASTYPSSTDQEAYRSSTSSDADSFDTTTVDSPEDKNSMPVEEAETPTEEKGEDAAFAPITAPITKREDHRIRTGSVATQDPDEDEAQKEIRQLLSRVFGQSRQETSEEEKTRHFGVVFKHLTVIGAAAGTSLQPTTGDVFLGLARQLWTLLSRGTSSFKKSSKTILDDFTGCIKPGELVLVLGQPGSGCSTFLKVIGNQRSGYQKIEGDVRYGGTSSEEMEKKFRSEVIYAPEDDLHYATLKVRDTLNFALETRTPGKESRKEGESRKSYSRNFLEVVTKLFWIEHTLDTKVGSAFVRGVSGGEKKRVSIAEALVTKATVQCWDNSTRGLDAATALEYVQSLRALTNMASTSTCVALYQAGQSIYELFDKVLLINEGQCCYFGPTEKAGPYFKSLGFAQPERWTTSDFLTSVTDDHERQIQDGYENRIPRNASEFAASFKNSDIYRNNLNEVNEFEIETEGITADRERAMSKATQKKNYTVSFQKQVIACTKRQALVMLGDKESLIGKWFGIVFQALITGSLFYNLPNTAAGVFTRGGVLFFMLLFNALLALAELTAAFESRPILMKHKSFAFYRPSAYAIAQTVIDVPLVFIQISIFQLIVYFMANLSRTPSQFFIDFLLLWVATMSMYAFFRAVGSFVSSLDIATRITGVAIQIFVVYTGYLIPKTKMRPWFKWLIWVNPIQYAYEGMISNEFHGLEIQCTTPYLVPPNAPPANQGCALQGSRPGSTTVLGDDYIETAFGYSYSHLWRNVGIIFAFFFFFVFLTAVGLERQKPNTSGDSVTVYKRGYTPDPMKQKKYASDEEHGMEKNYPSPTESGSQEQDVTTALNVDHAVLTWRGVTYTIPYQGGQRTLLNGISGYVKPGKLTALMGASGAGKTTLLNSLAQRLRIGTVTGDFRVDGKPLPHSFAPAYAEQMDIHEPTSTVREALRFSAQLRQPYETSTKEKYDYCEKVLDLLEMRDIAGAVIGSEGNGLTQEQRKRLTIGVELASKPDMLVFLDEPTSGLDSGAAFNIVRLLRRLADQGQTILCTIHQPSSVLFQYFDNLLLLKSGGKTAYFGPIGNNGRTLINYFESNGGKRCPPQTNPAEYMLDVIGAGDPTYRGPDYGEVWDNSKEKRELEQELEKLDNERQGTRVSERNTKAGGYATPFWTQTWLVTHRSFVSMWRSQDYVVGMMILHIFTGLFNAFTFWDIGNSQIDMQSRLFSIFMVLTISPPLIQQLQPRFLAARALFESRESSSRTYSWPVFVISVIVSEIPYRFVAGTLFFAAWYWPPSLPRDAYTSGIVWSLVMLFELYYLGYGQAIAAISPNDLVASLLVPVTFMFIVAFCGIVVPYAVLPHFWQSWMYHLTPFRYLLEMFLTLVTHDVPLRCEPQELARFPPPAGQSCEKFTEAFVRQMGGYVETVEGGLCGFCQYANGDQFAASFNAFYRFRWRDYGIFLGYIAFNFAMVFVFTWIYLRGSQKMKGVIGRAKAKREMKNRNRQTEEEKVEG